MPEHVDPKIADESSLIIPSSPAEEEEEEEFLEVDELIQQQQPESNSAIIIVETTIVTTKDNLTINNDNQHQQQIITLDSTQVEIINSVVDEQVFKEPPIPNQVLEHPTINTSEEERTKYENPQHESSPNSLLEELDHIFDTTTIPIQQQQTIITQICSSSSLTIPIKDFSLNNCSKVNNFQRRKRKDHPSPTLYEQQIKQHTKRTKTNPIYQNIPINFVSNSAFLLSNVIESSVPYNNTTVCFDDHSTHQCPWLDLLSNNMGNRGDLVVEESSVFLEKLQKLSLLQNSSSSWATNSSTPAMNTSRYSILTDPYCTIMRIGGRIYRETYSDHLSCTFNALINCGKDNKFLILQLQNNVLNDNIFTVYARFGQVGKAGQTYSRLFDNVAHAKQFFVDSLLALTEGSTVSPQCSFASHRVCYDIPSISFF